MKQFLTFLIGFVSILIVIAGCVCAVCAFANPDPQSSTLTIICGVVFILAWAYIAVDWFNSDMPSAIYEHWRQKFNNK